MKHHFQLFSLVIIASFVAIFTQTGCKENTLIKSKVLPSNNTVGISSIQLSVTTHTYYDDTAITSTDIGGIPCYQGVGTFYDPFFGTMTGSTYFQISYGGTIGNPFTSPYVIDSAILVLPSSGFIYGDTTGLSSTTPIYQTYQAFYILDTLGNPAITNYYSYNSKPIDLTNPLSDPVTINLAQLTDSFGTNLEDYNTPALRMKLRLPALLKYLTPALNILSTSTNLPQDFFDAFHGICIMPTNTQASVPSTGQSSAMPYFVLNGTNPYNEAGILIYSHDGSQPTPAIDTMPAIYNFDPTVCAHFNNITRSYKNFPVNSLLHSTLPNDSIIVLQNQPGASLDVIIHGIKSIPPGVVLNNAQLQINLLPQYTTDTAELPERLYPIGIGTPSYPTGVGNGVAYTLADRYPTTSLTPVTYMDGFYHFLTTANNNAIRTYTINIPREIMAAIAAGSDTVHMHINGTEDFYGAFKMVAGGGTYSNPLYQPKFVVTYSKLN